MYLEENTMKKLLIVCLIAISSLFSGCGNGDGNVDIFVSNFKYQYALVKWPDGTMKKIEIKRWTDGCGYGKIQITTPDDKIYLLPIHNTILVKESGN